MKLRFIIYSTLIIIILASIAQAVEDFRPVKREGGAIIFSPYAGYYIFEDGQRYGLDTPNFELIDKYCVGMRLGYEIDNHFDIETALNYVPTQHNVGDVNYYLYHADLVYNIINYDRLTPFVDFGLGASTFSPEVGKGSTDFLISYAAGLKIFIIQDLAFRMDLRGYTKFSETHTNFNATAGFTYYAGLSRKKTMDTDGDGIVDMYDLCPGQPETFNSYMDEDGCPEDKTCEDPLKGICEEGAK